MQDPEWISVYAGGVSTTDSRRQLAKKAEWAARPAWQRYGAKAGIFVLRWTVGLVFALVVLAVFLSVVTGWNPGGGG